MGKRLVVIGGVAAGMSAASRAKRLDPSLDVVVLERGNFISYGACSLPYFIAGNFDDYRRLIARTPQQAADQGIDVRTGHDVQSVDTEAGVVSARKMSTTAGDRYETVHIPYDRLVIATGARAIVPEAWNADEIDGVFCLRTIDDARAIRRWIGVSDGNDAGGDDAGGEEHVVAKDDASRRPRPEKTVRAVVVGGGYIGIEVVDALLDRGVHVTVAQVAPQLLTNFDADIAAYVERDLRDAGVDVRLDDGVTELKSTGGRITGVRLQSGETIPADIAVLALGVRPEVSLAEAAGIALGSTGAIAVDDRQQTSVPHVYAAGDCCEARHIVTGESAYIPLGTTANKQGRVVGTVVGGGRASFPGIVGTAVLKAHRVSVARCGLTENQAETMGYHVVTATIKSRDRVDSYPGVQDVVVKLVADKEDGRLLGGQVVSPHPPAVSGRIDVVATALTHRMTVERFSMLDLSYAPPFAPVWDPLLVAANVLQRHW